jgi:hypothetical protein
MHRITAILGLSLVALPTALPAQELTPEQEEVWQRVVECVRHDHWDESEGLEGKLECFHEQYSYWWAGEPVPFGKDFVRSNVRRRLARGARWESIDNRLIEIKVHGNAALVHFFTVNALIEADGSESVERERITFMMVKENGKWYYAGGAGS